MSSKPARRVRWADGFRGSRRLSARVAHAAIEAIRGRHGGRLAPEQVVHAARARAHPLHPLFDWNDGEAARKWRLHQARVLVGSIVVIVDGAQPLREYVHVRTGGASEYMR